MYQIVDNKGVIYSCDDEAEAIAAFDDIVKNGLNSEYVDADGWKGDLRLVHVLRRHR